MATLRQQFATNVLTVTRFRELMRRMRANRPNDDLELIRKAYEFSQKHHAGQSRASGEPYLVHPLEVALVLAEMKMDPVAIAAGLLHDSVEDTSVTVVDIRKEFGEQVAHIVEGVTKISQIDFATREEQQAENLRKMMLAMVDDIRVVLIKLADRLHNMRTLEHLAARTPAENCPRDARHLCAHRPPPGHGQDSRRTGRPRASATSIPSATSRCTTPSKPAARPAKPSWPRVEAVFRDKLKEAGITARVESRIKRLYSIHKKLQRQHITVEQVYDLYAMRVITQSVQDCYAVLGIIHNLWRPVPGRIKDFIAMPRPNFYQSLHTSVISEDGTPFEVQIRTEEMHKMAEEGIAAHWKYKDGPVSAQDEQRLAWLRQVVEWQRDVSDPNEFLSTLKIDLYPGRGLHLHAQGQGRGAAARFHADRFRLLRSHRSRPQLRGREGERAHGAAALQAAQRRHRRNPHPARAQAQPRLAGHRQVVARAQQDQALAERSPARARHRNRPQADRKRGAQVPRLPERHQGRRVAEDRLRLRRRAVPTT